MNADQHRTLRESLGAHVLGHLDGDEDAAVRAHLAGCAHCRAEVADLRPVVGPLSSIDPDALDATPAPPPDLGDRIVGRARAEGRRPSHRGAWLVAAAVAAAVVLGGGTGYLLGGAGSEGTAVPTEPVTLQAVAPGVDASAVAIAHTWGVEITLDADGFRPGEVYEVVVLDESSRRVDAGAFVGTGETRMRCNLNSPVLRTDAAGFDVVDDRGAVVVHGQL